MHRCLRLLILFLLFLAGKESHGQTHKPGVQDLSKKELWKNIAPYFSPPREFKGVLGDYRSPLKFYNGRAVRTPSDWALRREEIKTRWHEMMGQWPALMTHQQLQFIDSVRKDGFTQYRVSFFWMPGERTEGYLLVPDENRGSKKPAVVTVYYEPETAIGAGQPLRDFALQLTRRGFVTLSIGTTAATEAKTYALYYPDIDHATVQPLSMLACAAANAWNALSKVSEVDSTRIGIMGHSFGGKWAMFASCLYEKFACAVWSDPGIVFEESRGNINYWEPWYLGYHPRPWRQRGMITNENPAHGLYPKLVAEGFDLHELHALMSPRPFLVSGGEEDPSKRWIPLNHTRQVNAIMGVKDRVAMTNRPTHSPDENSNSLAYMFLEYFLK